jgi:DNA-directed RNA polymerase specialized sigma subunit
MKITNKLKELNILPDIELVFNIQSNIKTEKCLEILIERHSALCVDIANKYMSRESNSNLREEIVRDKDYQIYQSALKFDSRKGAKFSTYLGNEVKWKCLNVFNKSIKRKFVSVESDNIQYFSLSQDKPQEESSDIFNLIINNTSKHPDSRVGKIFNLRYIVGKNNSVMPWKNISETLGMSIQGCINIHNSAIKNMKNKIRKEINE